jgi:hypothetical protein
LQRASGTTETTLGESGLRSTEVQQDITGSDDNAG